MYERTNSETVYIHCNVNVLCIQLRVGLGYGVGPFDGGVMFVSELVDGAIAGMNIFISHHHNSNV